MSAAPGIQLACTSESYAPALAAGRLTLADWLRRMAEDVGLGAVELEDGHIGPPEPDRLGAVRAAADRHGLTIVDVALMNNFGVADPDRCRAEQARTVEWMAGARRLRSRFLRTFAGWPEGDRAARWPAMLEALRAVCRVAEREGVHLVMENHNHGGFVQRADDVLAIFDAVRSPALALLLDTGNYVDGLASIRRTAHLARHVHAKFREVGPDGRDALVDHEPIMAELGRAGYRGWVSVEYEGEEPGETAVPRALAHLRTLLGQ
ncbi:MAG TPA: sugar phosphate isomerase/epimerase family protein [Methylomirabilota bacterium]|jgi:L-ribulose-5-phosphate 3-epimerase|nr:sugar phosphate isomerase/epimerase family protein [Methylomirabilota bacterium]